MPRHLPRGSQVTSKRRPCASRSLAGRAPPTLPHKTEAEIRVQFNNAPSGARIDARKDAAAFQFETGAQFAF